MNNSSSVRITRPDLTDESVYVHGRTPCRITLVELRQLGRESPEYAAVAERAAALLEEHRRARVRRSYRVVVSSPAFQVFEAEVQNLGGVAVAETVACPSHEAAETAGYDAADRLVEHHRRTGVVPEHVFEAALRTHNRRAGDEEIAGTEYD
jgi:hypothetical protein